MAHMGTNVTIPEFDARMQRLYPWLPWREPIAITVGEERTEFACRLCLARMGLVGGKNPKLGEDWRKHALTFADLPKTHIEFLNHRAVVHGSADG